MIRPRATSRLTSTASAPRRGERRRTSAARPGAVSGRGPSTCWNSSVASPTRTRPRDRGRRVTKRLRPFPSTSPSRSRVSTATTSPPTATRASRPGEWVSDQLPSRLPFKSGRRRPPAGASGTTKVHLGEAPMETSSPGRTKRSSARRPPRSSATRSMGRATPGVQPTGAPPGAMRPSDRVISLIAPPLALATDKARGPTPTHTVRTRGRGGYSMEGAERVPEIVSAACRSTPGSRGGRTSRASRLWPPPCARPPARPCGRTR